MPTSDRGSAAEGILLAALIAANVALFAVGPWLRSQPLDADSSDPPLVTLGVGQSAHRILDPIVLLRNPGYLSSFFGAVRRERGVLFLGTSETLHSYNLGAQLNARSPDDPPMAVLAMPGSSPIHSALLFANAQRERMELPPVVIVINLVYFTNSHDVINDGWMSRVMRSEVFVQLDHRHVLEETSADVRSLYQRHFRLRQFLYPFYAQEYLGNLLYLNFHRATAPDFSRDVLSMEPYRFDGAVPTYDRAKGVHAGDVEPDQLAKSRWEVKALDECLNLKGLASTVSMLEKTDLPVLLLVLPTNRRFYAANGVDMSEYDRRYAAIRAAIAGMQRPGRIFFVDLHDVPWLDYGFLDRMHQDAYGFHQVAEHLTADLTYQRFIESVRSYYAR